MSGTIQEPDYPMHTSRTAFMEGDHIWAVDGSHNDNILLQFSILAAMTAGGKIWVGRDAVYAKRLVTGLNRAISANT